MTGNTNRWMDIQYDSTAAGYHIQQYDYGAVPTLNFNRGALFKFAQIGTTGRYVIRLMTNNLLSFCISNGQFITQTIHTNDYSVSASDTFIIQFWNGGYVLKPYGSSYVVSANHSTASGIDGAPDSYLVPKSRVSAGNMGKWELYQYNGVDRAGTLYSYWGSYVAGETMNMKLKTWSTGINANTPYISVSNNGVASSTWDSSNSTAVISCHDEGSVTIYRTIMYASTVTESQFSSTHSVALPFVEGNYNIVNEETERCMQPDNGGDRFMEQHNLDGSVNQNWMVEHYVDGYYTIRNLNSLMYLTSPSSGTSGENIVENDTSSTMLPRQLWKITETSSGAYKIQAKNRINTSLVVTVESGFGNGVNICQKAYESDSSYKDEWNFVSTHNKAIVIVPGIRVVICNLKTVLIYG